MPPSVRRAILAAVIGAWVVAAAPSAEAVDYERYLAPRSVCPGQANPAARRATKVRAMRCLLNHARTERGLDSLRRHWKLDRAARLKLSDNLRCDEFSHTACDKPFISVFRRAGYVTATTNGYSVGENLAWGQGRLGTPRSIVLAWLRSDGHRHNLFTPAWREMGVAFRRADRFLGHENVAIWANTFGLRR
jgi:uncharacterized protein YkwD